jgi:hypothetical protein
MGRRRTDCGVFATLFLSSLYVVLYTRFFASYEENTLRGWLGEHILGSVIIQPPRVGLPAAMSAQHAGGHIRS